MAQTKTSSQFDFELNGPNKDPVTMGIFTLRVLMGWVMLYAGVTKVLNPEWTAAGYLTHVPEANPLHGLWMTMGTEWTWLIDPLNAWGLTLVGIALIVGAFTKWSAFWGGVMMVFYWASSLPLQHAFLIDSHVIYLMVFFLLGAAGAGKVYGMDYVLENNTSILERFPILKYLI